MRAARAVQEAFGLRSTVAALGMALRTTAQLLEQGQLDALVAQHREQTPSRGDGPRGDGPRGSGSRQGGRGEGRGERAPRVDPFARPSRPAPAVTEQPEPEQPQFEEPATGADVALPSTSEAAAEPTAEPTAEA
jgi:hypothetical protein